VNVQTDAHFISVDASFSSQVPKLHTHKHSRQHSYLQQVNYC